MTQRTQSEAGTLEEVGDTWRVVFTPHAAAHAPRRSGPRSPSPSTCRRGSPPRSSAARAAGTALPYEFPERVYPGFEGRMLTFDPPARPGIRMG